jgi:O-antigen/teichoic acid export membrane protein
MTVQNRIVHNAAYLIAALIGRKTLTLFYVFMIVRFTTLYTTGLFFLIVSYVALVEVLVDVGLSTGLIREGAKDPKHLSTYFQNVLALKIILTSASVVLGIFVINSIDYPESTRHLVYMAILIVLMGAVSEICYAYLRSCQLMQYEAIGVLLGQFTTVAIGGMAVYLNFGAFYLILAMLANEVFNIIYSVSVVRKRFHLPLRPRFDPAIAKRFLSLSWPFAVSAFFLNLSMLDSVVLSKFLNEAFVAWHGVPSRIVSVFYFIPISITAALFPALSSLYVRNKHELGTVFVKSHVALLWFVLPVVVGIALLAPELIAMIFNGKYGESVLPLQIMVFSLVPVFLHHPVSAVLNATDRQRQNTWNTIAATIVHVVLILVMIDRYAIVGVAVSVVVSSGVLVVLGMSCVNRAIHLNPREYIVRTWRVVVATGMMTMITIYLKGSCPVMVNVLVSACVYVAAWMFLESCSRDGFCTEKMQHMMKMVWRRNPWRGLKPVTIGNVDNKGESYEQCR